MTEDEIQNRIEQVAYDGATDGYNQTVIEREAKKLTTEIVKLFAIPNVSNPLHCEFKARTDYSSGICAKCGLSYKEH